MCDGSQDRGGRAAQEVALNEFKPQLQHHGKVGFGLDALGYHPGTGSCRQIPNGTQELLFHRIEAHTLHEMFVDLDEIRSELRPQLETGKTLAQIIQGDGEAEGSEVLSGAQ